MEGNCEKGTRRVAVELLAVVATARMPARDAVARLRCSIAQRRPFPGAVHFQYALRMHSAP